MSTAKQSPANTPRASAHSARVQACLAYQRWLAAAHRAQDSAIVYHRAAGAALANGARPATVRALAADATAALRGLGAE